MYRTVLGSNSQPLDQQSDLLPIVLLGQTMKETTLFIINYNLSQADCEKCVDTEVVS